MSPDTVDQMFRMYQRINSVEEYKCILEEAKDNSKNDSVQKPEHSRAQSFGFLAEMEEARLNELLGQSSFDNNSLSTTHNPIPNLQKIRFQ